MLRGEERRISHGQGVSMSQKLRVSKSHLASSSSSGLCLLGLMGSFCLCWNEREKTSLYCIFLLLFSPFHLEMGSFPILWIGGSHTVEEETGSVT